MQLHKIILPTPYAVGDVNAFLLKGDALTLFDAGPKTQEAYEALQWGIRSAGYDMKDVEQVVLTHHHPDHAGWVDAFPEAEILGHQYVDHWMRQEPDFLEYRNNFYVGELIKQGVPQGYIDRTVEVRGELELFGTRPLTGFLAEGDEVPGHPGLFVYETPGHAQSHLIFLEDATRECIGGDLLLERVSSNPLVEPPVSLNGERPRSLLQYNTSLKKLRDLHVSKLYTGHGGEVLNASVLVEERLAKQHARAQKVREMITEPKTVFEVTKELFAKIYQAQLGLTLSETLGQLDYLVDEGLAVVSEDNGVNIYEKV
ncbi:MBL fold metallo-hydrolase [Lysinibacillus odysseyi]|uniref:Beta-lactamase n=1 Tax=Lysinibacillus odysseyi 34hs-1 = NBRC 100172 TaxID=1220589 RepID=A0A0A3IJW7_9BACI|nr:MBL fold metallo-hydrolase [Lysinibacillus odysseyi]KGR85051.1 beta-lactamase [Lysinibacillus odysseyi 34hs-1 = NBRC 100172]